MSTEDLTTLAELITKPHQKTENRKMWLFIGGVFSILLGMGYWGGDWHYWRYDQTDKVTKLSKTVADHDRAITILQTEKNNETAKKNSAAIVKTGK